MLMNVEEVTQQVIQFAEKLTEIELYPYQQEFAEGIVRSVLSNDGDELTGLFARQMGKCFAPKTPILLYDGSVKAVEDVVVGDVLMGDDSTPRRVLSLAHGKEEMYEVTPRSKYANAYTVNKSHILSVIKRGIDSHTVGKVYSYPDEKLDIALTDYVKLPSSVKEDRIVGYKASVEYTEKKLPVDPYWLGLWLGDGTTAGVAITSGDVEIVEFLRKYADELSMQCSEYAEKGNCRGYAITNGKAGHGMTNPLWDYIKEKDLNRGKYIPKKYLTASRKQRLQLLAGLIDSDGYRPTTKTNQAVGEITFKLASLAKHTQTLIQSLGFRCSLTPKIAKCQNGYTCEVYRLHFYGHLWEIPTKVTRKQWKKVELRENPLTYGFDLTPKGIGEYYGFVIDGNKRFLLADFTVVHNTEDVSVIAAALMVIIPFLAKLDRYLDDERMQRFRAGIWIGIFAPVKDQANITYNRVNARLSTDTAKQIMTIPGLGLDPHNPFSLNNGTTTKLTTGSLCRSVSASDQSNIEGQTYHLIICEECQDISNSKLLKSIGPMGAATAATNVKIGTPTTIKGAFFDAIERNKRKEAAGWPHKCHFEYDWRTGAYYNARYAKHIENEKYRLGETSDEFRMSYCVAPGTRILTSDLRWV